MCHAITGYCLVKESQLKLKQTDSVHRLSTYSPKKKRRQCLSSLNCLVLALNC